MSKQRGQRGERGIPGPPGPSGAVGQPGLVGARGAATLLTLGTQSNELAVVRDQIEHIYHELDVQMKRMAQLQAEVDQVRATLRRLMGDSD